MAKIVLSGDELVGILHANGLIPHQIADIVVEEDEIKIKVRTQWPVLKSLRVAVRVRGFEDGEVIFQLVTNRLLDTFDWVVSKMLESFSLEDYGGRWEYPRLYIDVNKLVGERLRGVHVDDVTFREGHFHVETTHPLRVPGPEETPSDVGEDTSFAPSL
jgi:hypothetical protein